jgi:hypothetical protein
MAFVEFVKLSVLIYIALILTDILNVLDKASK